MTDIRTLEDEKIQEYVATLGEKPYRSKQLISWLWGKNATSFQQMTDLSARIRTSLEKDFSLAPITVHNTRASSDGTIKIIFRLHDNALVEGVLIPSENRLTACISCQIGCSLDCKFCATGQLKKERNLESFEMVEQVRSINQLALEKHNQRITNIVFMGMGEPLLNYKKVMYAIHKLTTPEGMNISSKRITLSTAGITHMIKKLAEENTKIGLALSLHAAEDEKRNQIMGINESNSLKILVESLQFYCQQTKNKITLEYVLLQNFNDGIQDAKKLVQLARKIPCKINLIEYNTVEGVEYKKSSEKTVRLFQQLLTQSKIPTSVRRSRGKDIDAACGQLANKTIICK